MNILGYTWEQIRARQQGEQPQSIKIVPGADYGADPIGNGQFRMVPSGRIVDAATKCAILGACQHP